jgi:hypothetical protein
MLNFLEKNYTNSTLVLGRIIFLIFYNTKNVKLPIIEINNICGNILM